MAWEGGGLAVRSLRTYLLRTGGTATPPPPSGTKCMY